MAQAKSSQNSQSAKATGEVTKAIQHQYEVGLQHGDMAAQQGDEAYAAGLRDGFIRSLKRMDERATILDTLCLEGLMDYPFTPYDAASAGNFEAIRSTPLLEGGSDDE